MSQIIEVGGEFYIPATSSLADLDTRVLKDGETFAIFDRHGDIRPLGFEKQGLFHEGTRFVSRLRVEMNDKAPLLLSSNVKEDNDYLVADQSNPDIYQPDGVSIRSGTIHLVRTIFLFEGECFVRVQISNFGLEPVGFGLSFRFQADFVDLFEVRGVRRRARGRMLPSVVASNMVVVRYEGLDRVLRETHFHFSRPAQEMSSERAIFSIELKPHEQTTCDLRIGCRIAGRALRHHPFDVAFKTRRAQFEEWRADSTLIECANPQFDDWICQSRADLHMLLTHTSCGFYPFAGIPWFSCVFGRDGLITALETLWFEPDIARGVLGYLAANQATELNAVQDAEPGKIIHEQRRGEMAALGEIPFGRYYGTIDATPLFLVLAGQYFERTADVGFMAKLWPNIERALAWIDRYGDLDGDGFVEYQSHAEHGLRNQGWKDSEDSVFHADGNLAEAPIALCEVQGYVFEGKRLAAQIAAALGRKDISVELEQAAKQLKDRFQRKFWCEELGTYALALDVKKRPCRVRSSNAGHPLFSGLAAPAHAARIAETLLGGDFFGGWGIRTVATGESRYNPMSYHNGSVWPHDNAIIASGLARYGFKQAALRVLSALFEASRSMELNRLPELYCGFPRRQGEGPTLYPVACNPQAWASAAIFLLLQSVLGLRIDSAAQRVYLKNPMLPGAIPALEIANLKLKTGSLDLSLRRDTVGVAVNVTHRSGNVDMVVTA
ncbi:MAG TPA: amylo-alpha-1,6-glucosidase [Chthoniobacterales bacterium]